MNFEQLATIIADTHQRLQQSAVKAVNQCQTMRNWLIGFYIVEFEQNGEDRAKYGEFLLKNLEQKVNLKGLNITLFKRSRVFYMVISPVGNCNKNDIASNRCINDALIGNAGSWKKCITDALITKC